MMINKALEIKILFLAVFLVALNKYWENRKMASLKYHRDPIFLKDKKLYVEIETLLVEILYTGIKNKHNYKTTS